MSAGTYADFFKATGAIESGDNYGYVSPAGYLGYYQFAESTLQAVGFYNGDSTGQLDFTGGWTALAGQYGVHDKASFLASPAAQDAAETAAFGYIYDHLQSLDLVKYEGQTLNGVTFSASGLMAGANLVGVWTLRDYLNGGGDSIPTDGGGFKVSDYMARLSGYDTPYAFDHSGPISIAGGSGPDALHGFDGNDTLLGGGGANTLTGGAGADSILGGGGFDQVNGNTGDDQIDGGAGGNDWLLGGQGNDHLTAHAGNAVLNGNMGADTVVGGTGADVLHGGQGNDLIQGGGGSDQLYGDLGADTLTGGQGADVFHVAAGGGHDLVTDFNPAEGDRIAVEGGARHTVSQVGADTVIDLGDGDQLTLAGVTKSALPAGWIVG